MGAFEYRIISAPCKTMIESLMGLFFKAGCGLSITIGPVSNWHAYDKSRTRIGGCGFCVSGVYVYLPIPEIVTNR